MASEKKCDTCGGVVEISVFREGKWHYGCADHKREARGELLNLGGPLNFYIQNQDIIGRR